MSLCLNRGSLEFRMLPALLPSDIPGFCDILQTIMVAEVR